MRDPGDQQARRTAAIAPRNVGAEYDAHPMDDVASLISSVGTVIATAVSLYLLRQGQLDRRSIREEQRRSQARLVTIWADWNPDSPERFRSTAYPSH
jgi:hypothetical protein